MTLSGKTAVVTGAAGTIGSAISKALVELGVHVVAIDLAGESADTSNPSAEHPMTWVHLDLTDADAVATATKALIKRFGAIDILVNNAGVLSNKKIRDTTLEEWHRVNAINIDAAFLLIRSFLPGMRAQKWGRIINISSYAAKCGGLTAGTAYTVSKSALIGLTFATARETTFEGITANAIAPAYVMSPMVTEQLTAEQRKHQLAQIPVGRFCDPEEVAHAVTFLASPLAGFITGEVIDMNGGLQFD
ncbi:MAG: SDR family NAD(P)-dependent oxidoreductase [Ancalomicrobiaceae bacterium]|nr:SDR family NAD(P)-dependent oxidoreductase [Ancalomicrobiaceae bacterium]